MKKIYTLAIPLLMIILAALLWINWSFKETPLDASLKWEWVAPEAETKKNTIPSAVTNIMQVKQKNIFHPLRGLMTTEKSERGNRSAPPKFELIGICSIGDVSGAIINFSNPQQRNASSKTQRRYYALGSEVWEGFILDSVAENSVILIRGNETLELKVMRSRFSMEVDKNTKTTSSNTPQRQEHRPIINNKPPSVQPGVNPTIRR